MVEPWSLTLIDLAEYPRSQIAQVFHPVSINVLIHRLSSQLLLVEELLLWVVKLFLRVPSIIIFLLHSLENLPPLIDFLVYSFLIDEVCWRFGGFLLTTLVFSPLPCLLLLVFPTVAEVDCVRLGQHRTQCFTKFVLLMQLCLPSLHVLILPLSQSLDHLRVDITWLLMLQSPLLQIRVHRCRVLAKTALLYLEWIVCHFSVYANTSTTSTSDLAMKAQLRVWLHGIWIEVVEGRLSERDHILSILPHPCIERI